MRQEAQRREKWDQRAKIDLVDFLKGNPSVTKKMNETATRSNISKQRAEVSF